MHHYKHRRTSKGSSYVHKHYGGTVYACTWKAVRRCTIFLTAICVVPVLLVLFVTPEQYMRTIRSPEKITFVRTDNEKNEVYARGTNLSVVNTRMQLRRQYLLNTCRELGLDIIGNDTLHRPNPWEFLVSKKHHLVWCNVFKAGSTSWLYNFNILAGYSRHYLARSKQVPLNLARLRYPRPSLQELRAALNGSVSFLIARHPLERLLSGYRDKLQYSLPHTYHRKLGIEIIQRYRAKIPALNKSRHDLSWTSMRYPTFAEFISYLLDSAREGQTLDMHWRPITEFCTPCMFDFDVIAHTETLQEDQEYVIHKAGLQQIIKPEWKNEGHGITTKQLDKYYSLLSRSQILQLYHIYRYDFELFNYTLNGYLDIGIPDKDPSDLLAAITMKKLSQISIINSSPEKKFKDFRFIKKSKL